MSFRYKIALTVFALEAVIILTVLWSSLVFLERNLQQQIVSSNHILMQTIIDHSAKEAVITEDYGHLQYELEQIVAKSSIDEVLLLDFDNRVLASSNSALLGQTFDGLDGDNNWTIADISGGSGLLGKVAYRFSSDAADAAAAKALQFGIGMAIVGMLVVAAAGVTIGSLLTKRLEKIARSIEFIQAGKFEKFEVDNSKDEVGRLSRFIHDMTVELSSQVQQLQIGRERNRMALEVAGAGTWSWDIANDEFKWSAKYYQSLGLLPNSAKPSYKLWLSRVHEDDRKRVEKAVGDMMRNFADLNIEFRIVRPTGGVHWMHNVARIQFDHNGQPVEIYGLQIDITRFKQMADKNTNTAQQN